MRNQVRSLALKTGCLRKGRRLPTRVGVPGSVRVPHENSFWSRRRAFACAAKDFSYNDAKTPDPCPLDHEHPSQRTACLSPTILSCRIYCRDIGGDGAIKPGGRPSLLKWRAHRQSYKIFSSGFLLSKIYSTVILFAVRKNYPYTNIYLPNKSLKTKTRLNPM